MNFGLCWTKGTVHAQGVPCIYIMYTVHIRKGDSELISILFFPGATELFKIMKDSISPCNITCVIILKGKLCTAVHIQALVNLSGFTWQWHS